jgi:hypothetical protein
MRLFLCMGGTRFPHAAVRRCLLVQIVHYYYGPWRQSKGYHVYMQQHPPKPLLSERQKVDATMRAMAVFHCWRPTSSGSCACAPWCCVPLPVAVGSEIAL